MDSEGHPIPGCVTGLYEDIEWDGAEDCYQQADLLVDISFIGGWGFVMLGVSTCSKFLNLFCHLVLPTPTITRNKDEQWEYEERAIRDALLREAQPEMKGDETTNPQKTRSVQFQ